MRSARRIAIGHDHTHSELGRDRSWRRTVTIDGSKSEGRPLAGVAEPSRPIVRAPTAFEAAHLDRDRRVAGAECVENLLRPSN